MRRWSGAVVTNARAFWAAQIIAAQNAGKPILCPFCGEPVLLEQRWDVDHDQMLIDGGRLTRDNQRPSHRGRLDCPKGGNRGAGAREGNRRRTRLARRIRG